MVDANTMDDAAMDAGNDQSLKHVNDESAQLAKRGRGRPPKRPVQGGERLRETSIDMNSMPSTSGVSSSSTAAGQERVKRQRRARKSDDEDDSQSHDAGASSNGGDDSDDDDAATAANDAEFHKFRDNMRMLVPATSTDIGTVPQFGDKQHMFFRTTQVAHMATIFKCLSKVLSSSVEIIFFPTGWRITAVNSKKTSLVDLRITEHTLDEGIYDCNETYRVCLPLEELAGRFHMCRRYHVVTLDIVCDPSHVDAVNMSFRSGNKRADMPLRTLENYDDTREVPSMVYHNQVDLPADEFKEVVNAVKADTLISNIKFTKRRNEFVITVESSEGPISVSFVPDNSPDSAHFFDDNDPTKPSECLEASFSLHEIIAFTSISKASKWVRLNMPETHVNEDGSHVTLPLKVGYSLAALGEVSFFLAPRIPDENE